MARFLTAFAVLAIVLSGCKTLSLQGQEVKVTHHLEDAAECSFLGEVTAQPPFVGPKDGENTIRNKTAELGGDVVYYKRGQIGTLVGRSFDCAGRYASR